MRQPGCRLEFEVMGLAADKGVGENLVGLSQNGVAVHGGVVRHDRTGAYFHRRAYVRVGADLDVFAELRALFNYRCGMDFRHVFYGASPASIIANISSADEAILPSTLQVPSAHTNFCARDFVIFTSIWTWSPGFMALRNFTLSALHEIGELVLAADVAEHHYAGGLRHGFKLEYAWHYGIAGEMPHKERLVYSYVFDGGQLRIPARLDDPVDEHERIAVGKQLENPAGVERGLGKEFDVGFGGGGGLFARGLGRLHLLVNFLGEFGVEGMPRTGRLRCAR